MGAYTKYAWIGNQISEEEMFELYKIKTSERIPITKLVAQAVREFILHRQNEKKEEKLEEVIINSNQKIKGDF